MRYLLSLGAVGLLGLAGGVGHAAETGTSNAVVKTTDAERAVLKRGTASGGAMAGSTNKILLTAGQVLSRTTTGATKTSYHIAVPDRYDARKPPPLLVVFSPGGDGKGMMSAVRAAANKVGWMALGCDGLSNGMKDEDELRIEQELMRDIQAFIPYNPARLYYGGLSGGAQRAYQMTHLFKNPCAGILAFGGWLGGAQEQKKPFQRNMAVAMVNGDSDKGAGSWESSDTAVLKRKGCKVKVFHFPGGHIIAPTNTIEAAVVWLDQQATGVVGPNSQRALKK
jgi:poly(3-hydroxybutyrate) depolymerase